MNYRPRSHTVFATVASTLAILAVALVGCDGGHKPSQQKQNVCPACS